jgi:serine/threonine-protein kinase
VQCPSCNKIIKNSDANFCNHCGCSIKGLLRSGTLLQGRYKITKVLGGGAMGWVYLAHDDKGVRRAVKEMKLGAYTSQSELADALRLFRSEAEFLAKLRHPGLPLLVDVFDLNGKPYMVMEFIAGDTLEDVLVKTPGILTENQVMSWAEQLCEILAYLHEQKPNPIIHRDLKPSNIKLTANGAVRLLDFGIARSYKPGKIRDTIQIGTSGYCPIEQYGGAQTDGRSDIYALGATLYELLTKQTPPESTTRLTKNMPLPSIRTYNPQVSGNAEQIILKALGLRPEDRWQSAREMQAAIRFQLSPPLSMAAAPKKPLPLQPNVKKTTQDCLTCEGKGKIQCAECGGDGKFECEECFGEGAVNCPECEGSGIQECRQCIGEGTILCNFCDGDGSITCPICHGDGYLGNDRECRRCSGEGTLPCAHCSGKGYWDCVACSGSGEETCSKCGGTGKKTCQACQGSGSVDCETCKGQGEVKCPDCR